MIAKKVTSLATFLALAAALAVPARQTSAALPDPLAFLAGTWSCTTYQAGARYLDETDTIVPVGTGRYWLHGTARPRGGSAEPYYDYYIGHLHSMWLYVQIDPSHQTYFVGTSRNGTQWSITFPAEEGTYTYAPRFAARRFSIAYPTLTKTCAWQYPATPITLPAHLRCRTHMSDGSFVEDEYLSIAQIATPAPETPAPAATPERRYPWWQGIATDGRGRIVYEYNIFVAHAQRISVLINGMNGAYSIATSRLAGNLNDTTWVVVYPKVEDGFTFTDVSPVDGLPQFFTLNFKDGYQSCAPM